jgi:hypothetical protein
VGAGLLESIGLKELFQALKEDLKRLIQTLLGMNYQN